MKLNITGNQSLYIRAGKASFEEAEWLFNIFIGFPGGRQPSLANCQTMLERATLFSNEKIKDVDLHVTEFQSLPFILCLQDNTRIGVMIVSYHHDEGEGECNALNVSRAVIDPNYRGNGYFSAFTNIISAFAVDVLKVTRCNMDVVTSAPQVLSSINYMSPAVGNRKATPGWVEETDEVIIEYNTAKPSIDPTIPNISVEYDVDT
jgi:hypothetical protein